jgi:hypothetical protein
MSEQVIAILHSYAESHYLHDSKLSDPTFTKPLARDAYALAIDTSNPRWLTQLLGLLHDPENRINDLHVDIPKMNLLCMKNIYMTPRLTFLRIPVFDLNHVLFAAYMKRPGLLRTLELEVVHVPQFAGAFLCSLDLCAVAKNSTLKKLTIDLRKSCQRDTMLDFSRLIVSVFECLQRYYKPESMLKVLHIPCNIEKILAVPGPIVHFDIFRFRRVMNAVSSTVNGLTSFQTNFFDNFTEESLKRYFRTDTLSQAWRENLMRLQFPAMKNRAVDFHKSTYEARFRKGPVNLDFLRCKIPHSCWNLGGIYPINKHFSTYMNEMARRIHDTTINKNGVCVVSFRNCDWRKLSHVDFAILLANIPGVRKLEFISCFLDNWLQ